MSASSFADATDRVVMLDTDIGDTLNNDNAFRLPVSEVVAEAFRQAGLFDGRFEAPSTTAPTDTTKIWQDQNSNPSVFKYWDGAAWSVVTFDAVFNSAASSFAIGINDDTPGTLTLYGGGTTEQGGEIRAYLAADDDTTDEYWSTLVAVGGNLTIGLATSGTVLTLDNSTLAATFSAALSANSISSTTSVSGASVSATGTVSSGEDDTTAGILLAYGGGAAGSGGQLRLHNAADEDTTNEYGYLSATAAGLLELGWSATGAIMRTSADSLTTQFFGDISIGTVDTAAGVLNMWGGAATESGGQLHLYNAADHDTTNNYGYVQAGADGNLDIGWNTTGLAASLLADSTTMQFFGNVAVGTDDDDPGILSLYGGGTGEDGGVMRVYTGADDDTTDEYWQLTAGAAGDLYVGLATTGNVARFDLSDQSMYLYNTAFLQERASAQADTAGWGQVWVNNDAPNELVYTNDDGTDMGMSGNSHGTRTGVFYAVDYGFSASNTGAQNITALTNAIADANTQGGGIIQLPAGTFDVTTITITNNNIHLRGAGMRATYLERTTATGTTVKFDGCQHSGISDLSIVGWGTRQTADYALSFENACFETFCKFVRIDYCLNGIYHYEVSSHECEMVMMRYLLGSGIKVTGGVSNQTYGARFEKIDCDNPLRGDYPALANVGAWAASTAYSLNDMVTNGGNVYQCVTAGTSASSGGPTGAPGTTGQEAFDNDITDGTAAWAFVYSASSIWFEMAEYSNSISVDNSAFINMHRGLVITGENFWMNTQGLEIDHTYSTCVDLVGGEGFYASHGWWGSSLTGSGMYVGSGYDGEISVNTTRIVGCAQHGISFNSNGFANIQGNIIGANSQETSNTYDGINIAATLFHFTIVGNHIGLYGSFSSAVQRYGVRIESGTGGYHMIGYNNLNGNVSGGVNDNGTGSNRFVGDNAA